MTSGEETESKESDGQGGCDEGNFGCDGGTKKGSKQFQQAILTLK